LFVAAHCGNIDIVQLLVEEHNLIDQYSNYETCPLYIACFNGFTNITQVLTTLTEYSPEIKYRCLYTCCERGNKDTAKFLLDSSFDPNDIDIDRTYRTTHLQIACEDGHTDVVQLLLDYNAQIDKCNKDGESPLILATKHGYDGIVRLLLSKGACTNLTDGNGNTALSLADENDFTDIVDLLRQKMFIR
jgi:ankyrin repeat protein